MATRTQLKLAAAAAAAALLAAACGANAATSPEPPVAQPPAPAPAPIAPPAEMPEPVAPPATPPEPIAEPEPPAAELETATAALDVSPPGGGGTPEPAPQPILAPEPILETATRLFIDLFGDGGAPDSGPSAVLLIAYQNAPSALSAGDATIDSATLAIEGDPLAMAVAQSLADAGLAPSVSRVEVRAAGMDERYVRHFGGEPAPNAYIVRVFGELDPQQTANALQTLDNVRYACHAFCEDPNPPPPPPPPPPPAPPPPAPPPPRPPIIDPPISPPQEREPLPVFLWDDTIRVREGTFEQAQIWRGYIGDRDTIYPLLELRKTGGPNDDDIDVTSATRELYDSFERELVEENAFVVHALRDDLAEGIETAQLRLVSTDPSRVRVTGNSILTVEIVDEEMPFIWLEDSAYNEFYREGDTLSITVRAYPPPKQPLNFTLELTQGGTEEADFIGLPATGTIDTGTTEVRFDNIAIRDDGLSEDWENFTIEIKLQGDSQGKALISGKSFFGAARSVTGRTYLGGDGIALRGTVPGIQKAESSTASPPLEVWLRETEYTVTEGDEFPRDNGLIKSIGGIKVAVSGEVPLDYSDPAARDLARNVTELLRIEGVPKQDLYVSDSPEIAHPGYFHQFRFKFRALRDALDEPDEQFQITLVSRDTSTIRVRPDKSTAMVTIKNINTPALWLSPAATYQSSTVTFTVASPIAPHADIPLTLELTDAASTAATIPGRWTLQAGQTSTTIGVVINNPGEPLTFRLTLPNSGARLINQPWSADGEDLTFRLALHGTEIQQTLQPVSQPPQGKTYPAVELSYIGSFEHAPPGEWVFAFPDPATNAFTGNPSAVKIAQEIQAVLNPLDLQIEFLRTKYFGQSYDYHDVFIQFSDPAPQAGLPYLESLGGVVYSELLDAGLPKVGTFCAGCPIPDGTHDYSKGRVHHLGTVPQYVPSTYFSCTDRVVIEYGHGVYFLPDVINIIYKNPIIDSAEWALPESALAAVEAIITADLASLQGNFDLRNVRVIEVYLPRNIFTVQADGGFKPIELAQVLCNLDKVKYAFPYQPVGIPEPH